MVTLTSWAASLSRLPVASALWPLLILGLTVTVFLSTARLRNLRDQIQVERLQAERNLAAARSVPWNAFAQRITWPELDVVVGGVPDQAVSLRQARVVLLASQTACVAQMDPGVELIKAVASRSGWQNVAVVVRAFSRQYVASFARVNGLRYNVLYDARNELIGQNPWLTIPSVLLVGENGVVSGVATMSPSLVPGEDLLRGSLRWASLPRGTPK